MTATNRSGPISASESGSNALLSWARLEGSVDTRLDMRSITRIGRATTIGRRKVGISHSKLMGVLHQEFADCSPLAEVLADQHAAVFCLGTYTGTVPDTELRRITVDYTIEFARVLHGSSPDAAFAFLSVSGADPTAEVGCPSRATRERPRTRCSRGALPAFRSSDPRTSTL